MNCTAKRTNGEPCKAPAIRGSNVCRCHGGSAPQVKRRAAERLAALVDPAIGVLGASLRQRRDGRLALNAAHEVLDRAGFGPTTRLEVTTGTSAAEEIRKNRERRQQEARLLELEAQKT